MVWVGNNVFDCSFWNLKIWLYTHKITIFEWVSTERKKEEGEDEDEI